MLVPFQVATSSSTRVVVVGDLGDLAAHDPGDARRARRGRRRGPSRRRSVRSTPSSVVIFSPSRRGADDQLAAGDLVEVEGVQRLRGQQHHVVGDVDDVVDRPLAGRRSAAPCSQSGEGPIVDVGEDAGGEARAELGHLDRDRGVVGDLPLARRPRRPRPTAVGASGGAGDRVDLAGDAVDAEAVDPVRGRPRARAPARRSAAPRRAACPASASVVEDQRSRRRRRRSRARRSERIIPFGRDAAQLRLAELRRRRASPPRAARPATVWPAATLGAPQTIVRVAVAGVDLADAEPVGVRDAARRESTLPTTKPSADGGPDVRDPLDLGAGHRQPLGELLGGEAGVAVARAARSTGPSSELLQHPHVVLEELAQVGDAVLEHRDPLDPHPEGEALDPLGVVAVLARRSRRRSGRPCPAPRISIQPIPLQSGSREPSGELAACRRSGSRRRRPRRWAR